MEAFYKLAYDTGCYFAFASFFLSYTQKYDMNPFSFMVFFLACFLAVYADRLKRYDRVVQIGAFLLPLIPFLLESNIWGKIILILPWLYMVVTVLRQGFYITYRRFRKTYLVFFWIYVVLFTFFMADDFVKGEKALLVAGPFLVILLVSGSFLLQMLRMHSGTGDKQKLEQHQRRQLIVFLAVAALFTVGNVMKLLYTYVFFPLTELIMSGLLSVGVFVVMRLANAAQDKDLSKLELTSDWKEFSEAVAEQGGGFSDAIEMIRKIHQTGDVEPKEMDWTPFVIVICVVAAIVILAVLIGGKKGKRKQAAIEEETEEYFDDEVTSEKVLKKRFVPPEIVIRYYYREFMKKVEAKKHKLEASDTTKEILTKYNSRKTVPSEQTAEAAEATALYRKTRYSKATMTHDDANRMKALVKRL